MPTRKSSVNVGFTPQATPVDLSRAGTAAGLLPAEMGAFIQSNFTLQAASGVQTAFPSTCDVWTLEANTTYEFWGEYYMSTGTTSHTTGLAFLAGGGLTFTSIKYHCYGFNGVANTTATAQGSVYVDQAAVTVVTAAAGTAGNHLTFHGTMRINAAGTVTPQISFSANPTGTNLMLEGSFIAFKPWGSGTFEKIGSVG